MDEFKIVAITPHTHPPKVDRTDWDHIMIIGEVSFNLSVPRDTRVTHDLATTTIEITGTVNIHCFLTDEYEEKIRKAKDNYEVTTEIIDEEVGENLKLYNRLMLLEDEAYLLIEYLDELQTITLDDILTGWDSGLEISLKKSRHGEKSSDYATINFYPSQVKVTDIKNDNGKLDKQETTLTTTNEIYEFFVILEEL